MSSHEEVIATFLTRKNENDCDWNFRLYRVAILLIYSRVFIQKGDSNSQELNHGNYIAHLIEKMQQWNIESELMGTEIKRNNTASLISIGLKKTKSTVFKDFINDKSLHLNAHIMFYYIIFWTNEVIWVNFQSYINPDKTLTVRFGRILSKVGLEAEKFENYDRQKRLNQQFNAIKSIFFSSEKSVKQSSKMVQLVDKLIENPNLQAPRRPENIFSRYNYLPRDNQHKQELKEKWANFEVNFLGTNKREKIVDTVSKFFVVSDGGGLRHIAQVLSLQKEILKIRIDESFQDIVDKTYEILSEFPQLILLPQLIAEDANVPMPANFEVSLRYLAQKYYKERITKFPPNDKSIFEILPTKLELSIADADNFKGKVLEKLNKAPLIMKKYFPTISRDNFPKIISEYEKGSMRGGVEVIEAAAILFNRKITYIGLHNVSVTFNTAGTGSYEVRQHEVYGYFPYYPDQEEDTTSKIVPITYSDEEIEFLFHRLQLLISEAKYPFESSQEIIEKFHILEKLSFHQAPHIVPALNDCFSLLDEKLVEILKEGDELKSKGRYDEWENYCSFIEEQFIVYANFNSYCPKTVEALYDTKHPLNQDIEKIPEYLENAEWTQVNMIYKIAIKETKKQRVSVDVTLLLRYVESFLRALVPSKSESLLKQRRKWMTLDNFVSNLNPALTAFITTENINLKEEIKSIQGRINYELKHFQEHLKKFNYAAVSNHLEKQDEESIDDQELTSIIQAHLKDLHGKIQFPASAEKIPFYYIAKLDEAEAVFPKRFAEHSVELVAAINRETLKMVEIIKKNLPSLNSVANNAKYILQLINSPNLAELVDENTRSSISSVFSDVGTVIANNCKEIKSGCKEGDFSRIQLALNSLETMDLFISKIAKLTNTEYPELHSALSSSFTYEEHLQQISLWINGLPSLLESAYDQKKKIEFVENLLKSVTTQPNQLQVPDIISKSLEIKETIKTSYYSIRDEALAVLKFSYTPNRWVEFNKKFKILELWKNVGKELKDDTFSMIESEFIEQLRSPKLAKKNNKIADSFAVLHQLSWADKMVVVESGLKDKIKLMYNNTSRKIFYKKQLSLEQTVDSFISTCGDSMWSKLENSLDNDTKNNWIRDYHCFTATRDQLMNDFDATSLHRLVLATLELFSKSPVNVPRALAHIFAAWYIDNSLEACCPYPNQVLCLFHMLAPHNLGFYSQLLEILPGEGKSMILAICSIYLALSGYDVTCTSFSKYLSERDYCRFIRLFKLFQVDDSISYTPISDLCEDLINSRGNIQSLARDVLHKTPFSKPPASKREKAWLIDEVDTIFTNFFGETYNPTICYSHEHTFQLMEYIFANRTSTLTLQSIAKTEPFKNLVALFPDWHAVIRAEVVKMLEDVKDFTYPNYKVIDDQISYPNLPGVALRYKPAFVYLFEAQNGRISSVDIVKNHTGLLLGFGSFSAALIYKQFDVIMGVGAAISHITELEKEILGDYNITKLAFVPALYGESRRANDAAPKVKVYKEKKEWFASMAKNACKKSKMGRAVLIFFENLATIEEFLKDSQNKFQKVAILHEGEEEKESTVQKATTSGQVTLCTRSFAQGVDFLCKDENTLLNGGVHIILSYLTRSEAEEIQVKGRTARQGDPGSWGLHILHDDLKRWQISWETYEQRATEIYQYWKKQRESKRKEELIKLVRKTKHEHKITLHRSSVNLLESMLQQTNIHKQCKTLVEGICDYYTTSTAFKALRIQKHPKLEMSRNRQLERVLVYTRQMQKLQGVEELKIKGVLGNGCTGVVFLAEVDHDDKPFKVALKMISNLSSLSTKSVCAEYDNEFEILYKLTHPNIIQLLGQFTAKPTETMIQFINEQKLGSAEAVNKTTLFYALEYHPFTLQGKLEKTSLTADQFYKYATDIFNCFYYLYKNNVVHRDVKPNNILISEGDSLILSDFGESLISNEDHCCCVEANRGGNLQYCAPEVMGQIRTKTSNINFAKQYSWEVGCLLYEMLFGQFPFPGYPAGYGTLENIRVPELKFTSCKVVGIDLGPIVDLLRQLLKNDPDQRISLEEAYSTFHSLEF